MNSSHSIPKLKKTAFLFSITSLLLSMTALQGQDLYPDEQVIYLHLVDTDIKATVELEAQSIKTKAHLDYYGYYKNSIIKLQGDYVGRLLNGAYEVSFDNNSLKEKGYFKQGLKNGTWKEWTETGKLIQIENWKNGVREGRFTYFDAEGLPTETGTYRRGKLHGKMLIYQQGALKETKVYKKGEVIPQNRLKRKSKNKSPKIMNNEK